MKRFYLLAIAMISALSMLAETSVQNTFFGCTLGKSTSEEVQAAMISQGFKLRDSKSSNILGVQELDCNYTGKYNHEGREFPIFHTLFWNDTLAQVSFRDTCDGDCSKFVDAVQITQANLEQKYGYVGLVDDRSGLLAYNIDEHFSILKSDGRAKINIQSLNLYYIIMHLIIHISAYIVMLKYIVENGNYGIKFSI